MKDWILQSKTVKKTLNKCSFFLGEFSIESSKAQKTVRKNVLAQKEIRESKKNNGKKHWKYV